MLNTRFYDRAHRLSLFCAVHAFFRGRSDAALEILALRQQVAVLKRKRPRPTLTSLDRLFWTALRSAWGRWADVLVIVKPETVVGWHRASFRLYDDGRKALLRTRIETRPEQNSGTTK